MGRRVLPSLVRLSRTVRAQVFRTPVGEEVDEEFAFHVEMRMREHLAAGMTFAEAQVAAIRRFGDIDEVKAICRRLGQQRERRMRWTNRMSEFGQDARFALRQLRKSLGMSAAAILTLALGIGANTAVFSVVDGVLLSPLPFEQPGDLIEVRTRYLPPSGFDIDRFPISIPEFLDYREANRSLAGLGVYTTGTRTLTGPEGDPMRVPTTWMDSEALDVLGVEPQLGRWFTEEEDLPDVATGLIGHDLWVSRFGSDPDVTGTTMTVGGRSFLITGVMPEGFSFPSARFQIYENYGIDQSNPGNRATHGAVGIGRLKPGVTIEQVEAESEGIHAGWAEEFQHNVAHFPIFEPLADNLIGLDVRRALLILMSAVGVVLLIAVVNVANLLMARGESRLHEMAVRNALGARRDRIIRQLLTESLTLSVIGGLVGTGLAYVGLRTMMRIDPTALPRAELIGIDAGVLVFTLVVTVLTAVLFGLAPALHTGRAPASALGNTSRATSTRGQRRFRRALVASEVALSLVVVVAAGLILRSFRQLTAIDPGIDVSGLLTFTVFPPVANYSEASSVTQFYRQLQERLGGLPGVVSASAVSNLPLTGSIRRNDFVIEGRERIEGEPMWSGQWTATLPGYFSTMGIEPIAGRLLDDNDVEGAEPVVVVGQSTVDAYFGGEDPIGLRVGMPGDSVIWARIVGVVPDTRTGRLDTEVIPQVYFAHSQGPEFLWLPRFMFITVRTTVPPEGLVSAARAVMQELDPNLPMSDVRTMTGVFDRSVAQPRMVTNLLGAFALMAVVLAAVGIYGVVSYSVARRTREIGIRMALGARGREVSQLMLREGAWPAFVGVLVGVPIALVSTGWLGTLLYEVSPRDPTTFVTLALALLALAAVSSHLPARRATKLAPTIALREE